ncbi:hypothetical protein DZC73_25635 [Albitalea terrae]|uniref:Uncharacterized protein n=1 Tax=Piscinibacter terrae TaxID=2496871 RepID=A0A3N7HIF8_9BURK|nr:hypothetical protein DZC73_25635 [Albitalea terrae]
MLIGIRVVKHDFTMSSWPKSIGNADSRTVCAWIMRGAPLVSPASDRFERSLGAGLATKGTADAMTPAPPTKHVGNLTDL